MKNLNTQDMNGKICVVTGATSGIGKATAVALAEMGSRVIIISRDSVRCEQTVQEIKALTGNPDIEFIQADLSLISENKRIAKEILNQTDKLDVLVNNVGGFFFSRTFTDEGIEKTFALNHLSYFVLTNLLLPLISRSEWGRIINVASGSHKRNKINFNDLYLKKFYFGFTAYGKSKLANLLFTYELAERLKDSHITVNAMTPGFTATRVGENQNWLVSSVYRFVHSRAKTPEEGASTIVYLASSTEVSGITGKYFRDLKTEETSPNSYDRDSAKQLWKISSELTGVEFGLIENPL